MHSMLFLSCLAVSIISVRGEDWAPSTRFLDAVCLIESGGGRYVYGDDGRSLGHFQIQKAAWFDVSVWREKKKLPTYDYQKNVLNPEINRCYAADYLTMIGGRLQQKYKREPAPSEIYAAYNMGMNNFRKCNFDLANVNPVTARKCRLLESLLNRDDTIASHE